MEIVVKFTAADFRALRTHLLGRESNDEEAALLLAGISNTGTRLTLLVREVIPVPDLALHGKSPAGLTVHPDFLAATVKRCRLERWSFILAHSHPFSIGQVHFSEIDDCGEQYLMPKVQARVPGLPHGTIVFGQNTVAARVWLPDARGPTPVSEIHVVGDRLQKLPATPGHHIPVLPLQENHARQILALGEEGQRQLQMMRVAVVGAGGIGSQVYQQLAHLGVQEIVPVDYDRVERTNLSRIVGSKLVDVGTPKVHVLDRLGKTVNPAQAGRAIDGSVLDTDVALALRDMDVIFCCTDNLRSRVLLNRLARQYLIPLVDTGIDIQVDPAQPGVIRSIGGRVMVIWPDGPCLACLGILKPDALRREDAQEIHANGYVQGDRIDAPSVISFNGVVASLAVSEFLALATGYSRRENRTYLVYDGMRNVVRDVDMRAVAACSVCQELKAMGDRGSLPAGTP